MARYGKSLNIWVYVAIAVIPMILVIAVFVNGIIKIADYKEFIRDLDNSTLSAMKNNNLRAEHNGVSTRVTPENADIIFQEIVSSGYLFLKEEIDETNCICLDYGNGDELWLYRNDEESIIMRFVQPDEKDKVYLSNIISRLITFEHLVSTEWGNASWEDN